MKTILASSIIPAVRQLCMDACTILGDDVIQAIERSLKREESPIGREILGRILENASIAKTERIPLCQDTGMAVVFVEIGQNVAISGGNLEEAIHEGVRQGYRDGHLRKSVLHPITRVNTGDNTPAVIHYEIVPGDALKLTLAPKGFGSENMSRVTMFPPSAGIEGVKQFIVQRVEESGGNPCPPIVVGVGLGGTFEKSALLAKKSLLRPLGTVNPDPMLAELEAELLSRINNLGIGPLGLGGSTTALAVHVNTYPTHIASIPCAVNIQCHSCRHSEIEL
ncbi:fumarate hydratase [Desulfomonile tiedjei]|uniref:Hydro-lyase, Fe-S type, tartrate/fumarate subfamily n=1 Tax=Desulfomonile tiedjei (strain ATCC 49306 / DSM 6799 / DCB-1) TaxID=706587 RepID=I4CEY0_DESTA|nr:fumarate hydratase [Desulfomonile tiedjei]AFM28121.1 hydro-lyase, Fe-S type, tartrate/fumarate subfamily [Desulfomonile tiedjei DSM 6799]